MNNEKSKNLNKACKDSIFLQLFALFLWSVVFLEIKSLVILLLICIVGNWLSIGYIAYKRKDTPTKTDLLITRLGFLFYWVFITVVWYLFTVGTYAYKEIFK